MWYGKNDDEPTPQERLEKRVRELERNQRDKDRDDNFSMTGFIGGGGRADEDDD